MAAWQATLARAGGDAPRRDGGDGARCARIADVLHRPRPGRRAFTAWAHAARHRHRRRGLPGERRAAQSLTSGSLAASAGAGSCRCAAAGARCPRPGLLLVGLLIQPDHVLRVEPILGPPPAVLLLPALVELEHVLPDFGIGLVLLAVIDLEVELGHGEGRVVPHHRGIILIGARHLSAAPARSSKLGGELRCAMRLPAAGAPVGQGWCSAAYPPCGSAAGHRDGQGVLWSGGRLVAGVSAFAAAGEGHVTAAPHLDDPPRAPAAPHPHGRLAPRTELSHLPSACASLNRWDRRIHGHPQRQPGRQAAGRLQAARHAGAECW
jgi:hypothetical protein